MPGQSRAAPTESVPYKAPLQGVKRLTQPTVRGPRMSTESHLSAAAAGMLAGGERAATSEHLISTSWGTCVSASAS